MMHHLEMQMTCLQPLMKNPMIINEVFCFKFCRNDVPFDSTAGVIWTEEDLDLVSNAGQQYEYIEGKGIRYVNEDGYERMRSCDLLLFRIFKLL